MYKVNFRTLIIRLLPPFLRGAKMVEFAMVLIHPLVQLYSNFIEYKESSIISLSVTPSTYSIEWYLNYLFTGVTPVYTGYSLDYSNGGIWIENNEASEPLQYVFSGLENQETLAIYAANEGERTFLYSYEDYLNNDSFTIHVPASISIDENYLRSVVNKYKVAGNGYLVAYY